MTDRVKIFLFTAYTFNRGLPLDDEEGSPFIASELSNKAKAALHHGVEKRSV
jgi:hypothetical protein